MKTKIKTQDGKKLVRRVKDWIFRNRKLVNGLVLAAILVGALGLRVAPVVSSLSDRTFWYDEAFTGILLKAPWEEMNQMIANDVHPPLYYWLAKPWSAMFDYSPVGIRSFSLVFGMLTVASLWWIGSRLFGPRGGLLAAALAAISPFAIQYSQEARMYALFGFLFLWAAWFFYQSLDKNRWRDWLAWGALGGLCFYTHYLALFFFVMFYVAFYLYQLLFLQGGYLGSIFGRKRPRFWLGVAVIGVFFASWFKIFWEHFTRTDGDLGWIAPSNLTDLPGTLQIFLFGHQPGAGGTPGANELEVAFFNQGAVGLIVLVLVAVLFFYAWLKKRRRPELLVLTTLSLGTLILLVIASHLDVKFYVARYMMPAAVIFYLLLSGLIVSARKKSVCLGIFLLAYAVLLLNLAPIEYARGWAQLYQEDQSADYLKSRILVANGPFEYTSARYYFGQERVRFFSPGNLEEDFSGWVVVGNHNRLSSLEEIQSDPNFTIVDRQCEWERLGLEGYSLSGRNYGEMSLCAPKRD